MNLQNGYKVIYEKAADGKRTFYASKSAAYPNENDTEIASFNDKDYQGKVIYEYKNKFYVSNGEPLDTVIDDFDKVFIAETVNPEDFMTGVVIPYNPHTEAVTANSDTHGDIIANGDTVTIKATGTIEWLKSSVGSYGNWVGFRLNVPEDVDATATIYTRPNGKSSMLSEVLDPGKNYASVYSDMSKYGDTATYYIDWNGDGTNDLAIILDVTEATLVAAPAENTTVNGSGDSATETELPV